VCQVAQITQAPLLALPNHFWESRLSPLQEETNVTTSASAHPASNAGLFAWCFAREVSIWAKKRASACSEVLRLIPSPCYSARGGRLIPSPFLSRMRKRKNDDIRVYPYAHVACCRSGKRGKDHDGRGSNRR